MSDEQGWLGTDKLRIEVVTTFRDGTEARNTIRPPDNPKEAADIWLAQIDEYGNVWLPENDEGETVVWA